MLALAALALADPGDAAAQETLSTVNVTGHSEAQDDYRPTRSSTFTKTDTPLKEIPASVSVVPAQLMKDQAMRSLADVIRYVPGALAHQGEGNRDQFILRGVSTSVHSSQTIQSPSGSWPIVRGVPSRRYASVRANEGRSAAKRCSPLANADQTRRTATTAAAT